MPTENYELVEEKLGMRISYGIKPVKYHQWLKQSSERQKELTRRGGEKAKAKGTHLAAARIDSHFVNVIAGRNQLVQKRIGAGVEAAARSLRGAEAAGRSGTASASTVRAAGPHRGPSTGRVWLAASRQEYVLVKLQVRREDDERIADEGIVGELGIALEAPRNETHRIATGQARHAEKRRDYNHGAPQ